MPTDSEPWADILDAIYQNGGFMIQATRMEEDEEWDEEDTPLREAVDHLSRQEYHLQGLSVLREAELTTTEREHWDESPDHQIIKLTTRGFDVAHERQLTQQQQETNENIAFFTLILGLAAIIQATTAALRLENPSNTVLILLILLALTMFIGFYQSGHLYRVNTWIDRQLERLPN